MTPYHLSKHLMEETCRSFTDRYGIVTICLRPVWVAGEHRRPRPVSAPSPHDQRAEWAKVEYWAYVDMPDVCDATLRSLTVEGVTHDAFLLTATDTSIDIPTAELVHRYYPDTPWPKVAMEEYLADNPYRSLLDCSHAADVLGWTARRSWRDEQEASK
jgi:nucleoside-diphosphate-sugar epimerase